MAQIQPPRVGERTFTDGTVYQGEVADVRIPVGCVTKPAGNRYLYAGETRFAPTGPKRVGTGSAFFHNGGRYEGNWMGDIQHNLGWSITPGGEIYIGKWAAGERNGCGLVIGSEGDVYYGQMRGDAQSGWGAQQRIEWDETGETIRKGKWAQGSITLKRDRHGVEYMLDADAEIPAQENDLVIKAVQDAQTHVPLAIGQVQASFRAAMRADDAQMRAMAELDEAADDGTAQELKAFHSKSEANAVEALAGARTRAESGAYLNMANASIQAGIVEHRIAMAKLLPRDHERWKGIAEVAQRRLQDLRTDLRALRRLAFKYRERLRDVGMAEANEVAAFEAAQKWKQEQQELAKTGGAVARTKHSKATRANRRQSNAKRLSVDAKVGVGVFASDKERNEALYAPRARDAAIRSNQQRRRSTAPDPGAVFAAREAERKQRQGPRRRGKNRLGYQKAVFTETPTPMLPVVPEGGAPAAAGPTTVGKVAAPPPVPSQRPPRASVGSTDDRAARAQRRLERRARRNRASGGRRGRRTSHTSSVSSGEDADNGVLAAMADGAAFGAMSTGRSALTTARSAATTASSVSDGSRRSSGSQGGQDLMHPFIN